MENPFSRLLKVLSLERKQGYRNKAVIGGLDKFASRWESDARATAGSPTLIGEIVALLIGYPSVDDPTARERIIDQIVRRAREAETMVTGAPAESHARPEPSPVKPAGDGQEKGQPPAPTARPEAREVTPPSPPMQPGQAGAETGQPAGSRGSSTGKGHDLPARDTGPARAKPTFAKPEHDAAQPPSASSFAPPPGAPRIEPPAGGEGRSRPGTIAGAPPRPVAQHPKPEAREAGRLPEDPARKEPQERHGGAAELGRWPHSRPDLGQPSGESGVDSLEGWLAPDRAPGPVQGEPETVGAGTATDDQSAAETRLSDLSAEDIEEANEIEPRGDRMRETQRRPHGMGPGYSLDAPVTRVQSVGPALAEKLSKLGVYTVRDLLFLAPRRYEDYSQLRTIDQLRHGDEVTVVGTVWKINSRLIGDNRKLVTAVVGDGTGEIQMTWFNPFIERQLRAGRAFAFSGKVDSFRNQLQMRSPAFEPLESTQVHTGRLVPIYPLTEGLGERSLRKIMRNAVTTWAGEVPDAIPEAILRSLDMLPLATAIEQLHFPENVDLLEAARRRLSFDEFFFLQLGVLANRKRFRSNDARPLAAGDEVLAPYLAALPFGMTGAQRRVLAEIAADLAATQPMSRLLQGDVGSGKTAVAAAALWVAVANGAQGAIMAPTEILAEQHARSFEKLFAGLQHPTAGRPVQIALLTGRQRRSERETVLAGLAEGQIDIAIGTHALIQEEVTFRDLAVAVVDEQHRFGVEQRAALRQKGPQPHMLVMSATPIPRSLALTLYGDLDISAIDEMPAGRTPIKTKWLTSTYRERAYTFIRRQVEAGRQAFIIYPLVEESDQSESKAAVEEHARLQSQVFPALRLGLLHGRMKGDEKDAVMRAFAGGEIQILVATSVVEVGIDVPNATVIVIEGAERFGLAQLHQFRGRVGRGAYPSYCVLISDAGNGDSAQRLEALESNTDGFALAQIDLELRGPGDFLGTRQSGLPPLRMAQLSDLRTLEDARRAAQQLFAEDPQLSEPDHQGLAKRVAEFWNGAGDAS